MSDEIKIGDWLVRTGSNTDLLKSGMVYKVMGVNGNAVTLENGWTYIQHSFKKVTPPNPRHKHANLITAFAEGFDVEYYSKIDNCWFKVGDVGDIKDDGHKYRLKPFELKSEKDIEIEKLKSQVKDLLKQIDIIKETK